MGFTFKHWVLRLVVLKRIAVLKTLICNIFLKSVYRVKVCRLSCAFGGTVCLKYEIVDGFPKWLYHIFIKTSNFDIQPLRMCSSRCFLNWHSVITNSNIFFFQISYIESNNNGQNSGSLNMPFWHACTELSMLSTNFLDSTHILC